jgi:hypothetical protein
MMWVKDVARMGEKRKACRILVGKSEGNRPLRRSGEIGWKGPDWITRTYDKD